MVSSWSTIDYGHVMLTYLAGFDQLCDRKLGATPNQ